MIFQDKAGELIRDVTTKKLGRGFGILPIMAAVIYMACRLEGLPRTIKEICLTLSIDSKAVSRIYTKISKSLDLNNSATRILPKHLVPRLCSQLRLGGTVSDANTVCDAVLEAGILDGTTPAVSAAGVVYYLCKRAKIDVDINQLCAAVICDRVFMLNAYQKLLPHADALDAALAEAKQQCLQDTEEDDGCAF
jgi:transcription initiation factor TFIIB